MSLVLKNGTVFTQGSLQHVDILIENGKIAALGKNFNADNIIDITNLTVLPGLIDVHVHFRQPGHDHKEDWSTASRAAAAGGVTTVLDMPNNDPSTTAQEHLQKKCELAKNSLVNYGFYIGATRENIPTMPSIRDAMAVGSSRVDLQACKLEYSIVSPK